MEERLLQFLHSNWDRLVELGVVTSPEDWVFTNSQELRDSVQKLSAALESGDTRLAEKLENATPGPPIETLYLDESRAGKAPEPDPQIDRKNIIFDLPRYLKDKRQEPTPNPKEPQKDEE